MVGVVTVCRVGRSLAIRIPQAFIDRLRLQPGDRLCATETKTGFLLTPFDPEFEKQRAIATQVAERFRPALRELAR